MLKEIIIAGFGGQGILFTGKLLAYTGMKNGFEVSWLPSYGPEMRGGTANCSVIISSDMIGSPLVTEATEVIAMNGPSFEKFESTIIKGGTMFYDSSLIYNKPKRDDINYVAIEATKIATDNNMRKLANMIMIGKVIKDTQMFTLEQAYECLKGLTPSKKPELYELNKKALDIGVGV